MVVKEETDHNLVMDLAETMRPDSQEAEEQEEFCSELFLPMESTVVAVVVVNQRLPEPTVDRALEAQEPMEPMVLMLQGI